MTTHPSPIGPDHRLNRAVPSTEFVSDLRSQLLREHATRVVDRSSWSWGRWLSLPLAFTAIAAVVLLLPKNTPNAYQFLERAEAEMNSFAEENGGIHYSKKREYWPQHIWLLGSGSNDGYEVIVEQVPYIQELWDGVVDGNRLVMMDRRSDEQGHRQFQRLSFYPQGDEDMLYPETAYYWWPDAEKPVPICVNLEMSEEESKEWNVKMNELNKDMSGSYTTTFIQDEDTEMVSQITGGDASKNISALKALLKKGSVREVSGVESDNGNIRSFRMDALSSTLGADGMPLAAPEVSGYSLYTFNTTNYKFIRLESYSIVDGEEFLDQRTEYLEDTILSQEAAAELFDPKKQALFDPWEFIPVTREQLESTKAELRCYYKGKWLGNDYAAIFDLPQEAQDRKQDILFGRIYSRKSMTGSMK